LAEGKTQSAMCEKKENIGAMGRCMEEERTTDTMLRNLEET
jgi:hypothetical protein